LQNIISGDPTKPPLDTTEKKTSKTFYYPLCISKANISGVEEPPTSKRGIFDGLTIYVNGSTNPLISDHKLKYLLVEHGAKISISLGRRQVTHVILGNPCGRAGGIGAGGGLAATKIQKEIRRRGGCGIRYVSVEW
jgi:twin BRCT domain